MSWHFLAGQEEASWEGNSLDGAPSALLSMLPTQDGCCSPDSEMDSSTDFPSGTTCELSMESHGEERSMSLAVGSHANGSQAPLVAETTPQTDGQICELSPPRSWPQLCGQKTSPQKPSTKRQTILRRWATKQKQSGFQRQTWVLTTFGQDTGYLHTPTTVANYCAPSMQKWGCCRTYTRVFGQPTPENQ